MSLTAAVTGVAAAAVAAALAAQAPPKPLPDSAADTAAIREFNARVADYMETAKTAAAGVALKASDQPEAILAADREFAARLQAARAGAKAGDLFSPAAAAMFRRRLAETFAASEGAKIRESLKEAEPGNAFALRVGAAFPGNVPLQSTPPTLLLNLPKLPDELEYRVVGSALVLRDRRANQVVDWIPHAIPAT